LFDSYHSDTLALSPIISEKEFVWMNIDEIKGVVSDMDGVLWRGDEALPGMVAFFETLRNKNIPFVLATNNSTKTPLDYVQKLAKLGVPDVPPDHIITSSTTTVSYLRSTYPPGTPVHVLGGDGLRQLLSEAGFFLTNENARAVIVGLDTNLTYEKLKRASFLIQQGAKFIATNNDNSIPTPDGLAPGAGSLVAALRAASAQEPVVMGKPDAPMFETALRLLGVPAPNTLMIGDRLNTDITGAVLLGMKTALVLTGVSTRSDVEASPVKPDAVYEDLIHFLRAW